MERAPVVGSAAVISQGYDVVAQVLEVEMPGGRVYQHWPVDQAQYDEFMRAPSKGRFLAVLRAGCSSQRVE